MVPAGWTISRRGDRWEIVFENSKVATAITLTPEQFSRFLGEASHLKESVTR